MRRHEISIVGVAAALLAPGPAPAQDKYMNQALDAMEAQISECVAFYSISIERYDRAGRSELVARIGEARQRLMTRHMALASERARHGQVPRQHEEALGRLTDSLDGTLDNYPELLDVYGMTCKAVVDDFDGRMLQLLAEAFRTVP